MCEMVGILGAYFTTNSINNWYAHINKPLFSPPNWIFGPVWTILYLLIGISFYLLSTKGIKRKSVKIAVYYFLIQLIFNFFWSPVFFGLKSPFLGLIVIVFMWIFIAITIIKSYGVSKMASYLLIPYLLWVSFATILNASIFILN